MIKIAGTAVLNLRHDLFSRLQQLSLKYFDSTPTGELMSRFTNDIDNISTTLNQSLLEIVSSILVVIIAYGMQADTINRFIDINNDLVATSIKAQTTAGLMAPLMNGISNINLAIIVVLTIKGEASVGLVVTFINFARQFFQPLNQLANLYNQIQLALTGAERVFEVMDQVPDIVDIPKSIPVTKFEGVVDISHLDFSYVQGVPILKDVIIHVDKGNMLAIIGPTGSGKSTIMNLLPRFYDYIMSLHDGCETMLNSNATALSTGQKQLLSIARTIISNPDILILDEATSNIDTRTEIRIQEAMNNMMKGRNSFVIAHRLKTILHDDQIIVLKDGQIFEQCTHKALIEKNGFYAELYRNQFNI